MTKHLFYQYALHPMINGVIEKLGFHKPTDIQQKVIPAVLRGESIIGKSHTGSGKTHAYLLPLFSELEKEKPNGVQFVVTAPTRELATQIYDEVRNIIELAEKTKEWNAKLLIGGTDKKRSIEKLKEPPHIVVGTPSRILDLVKEEALNIHTIQSLIIDEADLMLDLGFIQEVDQLLVRTNSNVQILVFSATIPERLQPFLNKYLEKPSYLVAGEQDLSPETMEHRLIPLRHRSISEMVYRISKTIQPYLAIIFTNGKDKANELAIELTEKGLEVGLMHGGLTPRERKRALKDIQQLKYQYIVATDLAARGIDIKGVSHVINAQLPKEEEFYIHRVGRTARAGMEGTAVNLYTDEDIKLIERLEKKGLTFDSYDINQDNWVKTKAWNERKKRKSTESDTEKEAWKHIRKPKNVKPGYKKKMKKQQEQVKKKIMRNSKFKK
ncbi:DEAD/DEAH box helicase [Aquibacillus sp. 3ASR75-11]|uniref:DEAD/DEAH box helicase n=1 Tax=Terrihalobacillus insolitus TaxID=2950438 RepID=A0A9X3WVP8_9BACI|nr:DEAD/DEAH box helicase [Terrihalobacillus insolitus]MDC3413368.1 DEAD/DEAH box helicase [Terrihalobacillus insolitus]MDC3424951.1 DEAD/DEAH box helicase [Terrihalobacillus insolitus]